MALKKAFQLSKDNSYISAIAQIDAEIKVATILLTVTQKKMEEYIQQRDTLLNELLLNNYKYIVSPNDKISYSGQLHKIFIYDSPEPNTNYGQEEKK